MLASGLFEPLFYLLGIGFGLGALVGHVPVPERPADPVRRLRRAGAARLVGDERRDLRGHVQLLLQAAVREDVRRDPVDAARARSTSRSARSTWALIRGALYATAFVAFAALLGLIVSPWAVLAIPVALLIGFAFGAVGHGRDVVLPDVAGLRPRPAGDPADVPVLGHVLPDLGLSRRRCSSSSS